jgi:hypothetical protein
MHVGMKVLRVVPITLVFLALLVSCVYPAPASLEVTQATLPGTPTGNPYSTSTPSNTNSPIPTQSQPSLTPTLQLTAGDVSPSPIITSQVDTQYNLDAALDYYAHTLSVTETISYVNQTSESIPNLALVVEANRWIGSFSLLSLTWTSGELIEGYNLENALLDIPLNQALGVGGKLGLKLVYRLDLPEIPQPSGVTRPVPYGYSQRQTNIVDWYPYIPPYLPGTGWVVHPKWGFGEHQVFDVADFNVHLTLIESVSDLLVAASAPAEQDGLEYRYHLGPARTFAFSASTDYLLQTTVVGDVTVYSYSFPYDQKAGEQVLHDTAAALELYNRLFIPYQHSSLTVVEADFLDGMEYDGLYFLSRGFYNLYDGTPQGYLTFIAAHETAHQWWYGLVGNDQALEPWLDEAMCTYMEHVFYENVYADYQTSTGESIVDWWWYYRVNFYDPRGRVNSAIYDFNLFRPYRDAVYLNGAKFFQDLRTLVGDKAFFAFLKDYANREANHIATANDFFAILRGFTSKNLDGLFATFFQNGS